MAIPETQNRSIKQDYIAAQAIAIVSPAFWAAQKRINDLLHRSLVHNGLTRGGEHETLTVPFLALFFAISVTVHGQQGGANGGHGSAPTPQLQPESQELKVDRNVRPVFLSGRVAFSDGSPPPEGVVIQRVCNGFTRNEAWTDDRGRFNFQLGKEAADLQDLSQDANADPNRVSSIGSPDRSALPTQPETTLSGCTLQASLPGYKSESFLMTSRDAAEKPDIGVIYLRRLGEVQGDVVSATTLMAPRPARRAFEKGESAAKKMRWDQAAEDFREALKSYPQYAAAWYDLGQTLEQLNAIPDSIAAFSEAVKIDAKFLKPYQSLVTLQIRQGDWTAAERYSAAWIAIDPVDYPQAYLLNAFARVKLNKLDDAERSAREGYRLDTQRRYPRMSWLLGFILAERREFAEAAQYLKQYLTLSPGASDASAVQQQVATLEKSAPRMSH